MINLQIIIVIITYWLLTYCILVIYFYEISRFEIEN